MNIGNQGLDQPVLDWTIELTYGGGDAEPLHYVVHVCRVGHPYPPTPCPVLTYTNPGTDVPTPLREDAVVG